MGGNTAATWGARTCKAAEAAPRGCLCAQHTGCAEGAASLRSGLLCSPQAWNAHAASPWDPGPTRRQASQRRARVGGIQTNRPPLWRLQSPLTEDKPGCISGFPFQLSPGVAGSSLRGRGWGGMGPKNFLPIGGPGCSPADGGKVPNRTVESPCPRASIAQRAREAAPGSGLPGPDLSSAISCTLGSPAGGQPSPPPNRGGSWGGVGARGRGCAPSPPPRIPAARVPKLPLLL